MKTITNSNSYLKLKVKYLSNLDQNKAEEKERKET